MIVASTAVFWKFIPAGGCEVDGRPLLEMRVGSTPPLEDSAYISKKCVWGARIKGWSLDHNESAGTRKMNTSEKKNCVFACLH